MAALFRQAEWTAAETEDRAQVAGAVDSRLPARAARVKVLDGAGSNNWA
ncbi:MAG TPA: hypothetical protein VH598_09560 [Verrucomicrobiae bacterium]|nr:hypothetical protein [Verrucomicrobiae bacterium]